MTSDSGQKESEWGITSRGSGQLHAPVALFPDTDTLLTNITNLGTHWIGDCGPQSH